MRSDSFVRGEVRTDFHLIDGDLVVNRVQDVADIIDHNKFLQGEAQKWAGTYHHIGCVPNVILEKWMNEEGAPNILAMPSEEFGQFIKRKLRDPDNAAFRTTNLRI
jgi:hypothetical protein